jgi:hypothetical protein
VLVESPAFRAEAFFWSAQRFFAASDMRFLAAGLMPRFGPRLVAAAVTREPLASFDLRIAAHRAFTASDGRRLPAAVIPPRFLAEPAVAAAVRLFATETPLLTPPSKAEIACSRRPLSIFNSATIRFRSIVLSSKVKVFVQGGRLMVTLAVRFRN